MRGLPLDEISLFLIAVNLLVWLILLAGNDGRKK